MECGARVVREEGEGIPEPAPVITATLPSTSRSILDFESMNANMAPLGSKDPSGY